MAQVIPQVRVFQEFELVPTAVVDPLRAFIFGPHYSVRSYAKAKSDISLGAYDYASDTDYSYPGRLAGEVIDQSFTTVHIDDALIRFFEEDSGGTGYDPQSPNKVVMSGSDGWEEVLNSAGAVAYSRLSGLLRDVAVGDYARITDPSDSASTLLSQIKAIGYEAVAASLPANTTVDSSNDATPGSPGTSSDVSAPGGTGYTLTVDASDFKGYIGGQITERYTFTVTKGGALGVAEMTVESDSGLDDVTTATVVPAAPTAVGDWGLQVSWAGSGGFNVGDQWVIDAVSNFTAPSGSDITVSGTYTGSTDATYILEVVTGGEVDDETPTFSVTTSTGIDNSGPHSVTASATAISIGSLGVSVAFGAGVDLNKGDRFTIAATAATTGRASTIELVDSIPSALLSLSDVDVEILAKKDIQLPENRTASVVNWSQSGTTFTLKSGALYDSDGDAIDGEPIVSGTVYLSYRALSQSLVDDVQSIDDSSDLSTYFSDLTTENPLGFAVKQALANSNGTAVKFIGVPTNDLAGYTSAVNKTLEREDVYSFVPLTTNASILSMVSSHVEAQSSAEKGRWRIAWFTQDVPTTKQLVGSTAVTGTLTYNTGDAAGIYRLLTVSGGNFITNAVAAGDEVRFNYSLDASGAVTYETDTVDSVLSETQLLVLTGKSAPINTSVKVEVWRNLTTAQKVTELVNGNTWASRRIYNVLAGGPTIDGEASVSDFYLAALYAGLRSGVAPHQGLTSVEISGVTAVPFLVTTLNGNQLDTLMSAGFWLTVKDPATGSFFCRKQISTLLTDINTTEQSVTTNVDSLSYYFKEILAKYIGRANNVASTQQLISGDIEAGFEYFYNNATATLGSQVLPQAEVDGEIDTTRILYLRPHATMRDRLVIRLNLLIPYPLNNIDLYLVV